MSTSGWRIRLEMWCPSGDLVETAQRSVAVEHAVGTLRDAGLVDITRRDTFVAQRRTKSGPPAVPTVPIPDAPAGGADMTGAPLQNGGDAALVQSLHPGEPTTSNDALAGETTAGEGEDLLAVPAFLRRPRPESEPQHDLVCQETGSSPGCPACFADTVAEIGRQVAEGVAEQGEAA